MVETAPERAADDAPRPETGPHATLDELAAEPERVASVAEAGPVRIDRPNSPPPVLVSAETFARLTDPGARRALHVSELTDRDLERMRTQPVAPEAADFDHEGDFLEHG